MQRLIRRKFSSHTIIAVAHKLESILDFDKVAVLDGGELIEYDDPYALLSDPESSFSMLYNNIMAEQVEDVTVENDIMIPRAVLAQLSNKDRDLFPQE
jgi:ATP-binding cassette, subfamily C (CFTR/MRP), member 1